MKFLPNKKMFVVMALIALLVLGTAVVQATTITVDGVESDWPGTVGLTADPGGDEAGIPNDADIEYVKWTNDTTNMYYLVNSYSAPLRFSGSEWVLICMDIDNNTSTGSSSSSFTYYDNCNNQNGIDRLVQSFAFNFNRIGTVDNSNNITWNNSGVTLGFASNDLIELSVSLTGLLGAANCPELIPTVVYLDGADTSNDDHTPDTGTVNTNCGTPTAVTLQDASANSTSTTAVFVIAALFVVALLGASYVSYQKKQA